MVVVVYVFHISLYLSIHLNIIVEIIVIIIINQSLFLCDLQKGEFQKCHSK